MAFNYSNLEAIRKSISDASDGLAKNLNEFSRLIDENVNNTKIWSGESANRFKEKWNKFEEKFPEYQNSFKKEISNFEIAINAWSQSEN